MATTSGLRYFAIFFSLILVSVAMILVWVTNTSGTDSKRAGGLWILTRLDTVDRWGRVCFGHRTALIMGRGCGFVLLFPFWCVLWRRIEFFVEEGEQETGCYAWEGDGVGCV